MQNQFCIGLSVFLFGNIFCSIKYSNQFKLSKPHQHKSLDPLHIHMTLQNIKENGKCTFYKLKIRLQKTEINKFTFLITSYLNIIFYFGCGFILPLNILWKSTCNGLIKTCNTSTDILNTDLAVKFGVFWVWITGHGWTLLQLLRETWSLPTWLGLMRLNLFLLE